MNRRPASHVVYFCHDAAGELIYIGSTWMLSDRIAKHRHATPWWGDVATITTLLFHGPTEGPRAEHHLIRSHRPRHNKRSNPDWLATQKAAA